ncbi:MAG: response regulator [Phycisphaerales bacterium]|nr:response regulator [Phycisphaerales bacterium]
MTTPNSIIWIDDNPDRAPTAAALGAKFIDVKGEDLAQKVDNLLSGSPPALVVLDHILDKTTTTNPLFQRGSTIAEAVKEKWPSCPVVGVTNARRVEEIDRRTKGTYDALYPFSDFRKYLNRITPMRLGFANVSKAKVRKALDLIEFLKSPDDERERLVAALPEDLKKSFKDASLASRLYRWVDHLMCRPGFLLDSLSAATLLGLNDEGFKIVVRLFSKAKYNGVFARDDEPRWWSSRLSELLYKQSKPMEGEMSWQTGARLPRIKGKHLSRCYVCKLPYPETVGYLDEASTDRRAMHLRCTVLHPKFQRELYFEDIRMMKGE